MAQPRTSKECKSLTLFGGDEGWNEADWVASDDTVRGGKSKSCLDFDKGKARFHGVLDIETLGGAGFASQRTTGDDRTWDLSEFAGIQLDIAKGDKKRYTFIAKDTLPSSDAANGRDQATISWEVDFELPPQDEPDETHDKTVFVPWDSFNPTYRGKLQKDVDPLDTKSIKRFSIMMRSFFGAQEGDFSLTVNSIKAVCEAPPPGDDTAECNFINKEPLNLRQLEEGPVTAGRPGEDRNHYSFNIELPRRTFVGNITIHRRTAHVLLVAAVLFAAYHYLSRCKL